MIATTHRIHDFVPARTAPSVRDGRTLDWIGRVAGMVRKDPLVILVAVFDALFYGGVIALLAHL